MWSISTLQSILIAETLVLKTVVCRACQGRWKIDLELDVWQDRDPTAAQVTSEVSGRTLADDANVDFSGSTSELSTSTDEEIPRRLQLSPSPLLSVVQTVNVQMIVDLIASCRHHYHISARYSDTKSCLLNAHAC
jgi:hypothetical protein